MYAMVWPRGASVGGASVSGIEQLPAASGQSSVQRSQAAGLSPIHIRVAHVEQAPAQASVRLPLDSRQSPDICLDLFEVRPSAYRNVYKCRNLKCAKYKYPDSLMLTESPGAHSLSTAKAAFRRIIHPRHS